MTDDDVEFVRFRGKTGRSGRPDVPILAVQPQGEDGVQGHFNNTALDLLDTTWINVYVSHDPLMIAVKPVSGGDVDGDSYKLSGGNIGLKNILEALGIEWRGKRRLVGEGDADGEMLVFDLSEIRDQEQEEQ